MAVEEAWGIRSTYTSWDRRPRDTETVTGQNDIRGTQMKSSMVQSNTNTYETPPLQSKG